METAAEPPREFQKHTRACFRCKLVKTFDQVRARRLLDPPPPPSVVLPAPPARAILTAPPTLAPPPPPTLASQFFEHGCENCAFFQMEDDRDRVVECTTPSYSGVCSVIDPKASWAAKWLRLQNSVPGCYALEINDDVPESVAQEIEERMDMGR